MTVKDHGYPWIVKWGNMMRSDEAYIRDQVEKAVAAGAPENATHEDSGGGWSTTDDVISSRTRVMLGLDPLPPTNPLILEGYEARIISAEQASGLDNFLYRIRFPSLTSAATWVTTYKVAGDVTLIGAETPPELKFDQPVTLEYLPDQ